MKKGKEWLKEAVGELNSVDTVFEADGVSYIDTAVSVMQVYDFIDQLDEPEKVVIPQFVADWWERDGDSVTLYGGLQVKKKHKFDLVSSFHDKGLGDYLSRVEEWVEENKSTFLDLVNGKTYEIEKEEFYQVIIPTKDAAWKYYYLDYDGGINAGNDLEYVECHTETFIRSVSDDLWQFAVEVTE